MKTLEQKRDELRAKLEAVEKQIKDQKPVDGWYLSAGETPWMFYLKDGEYCFGIDIDNNWHNDNSEEGFVYEKKFDRLATPEEVTKRLTEFVNGLGYKEGVKVKSIYDDNLKRLFGEVYFVNATSGFCIWFGNYTKIWSSKKGWAKIIEEPKYKVEPFRTFGVNILKNGNDLEDSEREQLAKEIETFLNSKSETFTTK